MNNPYDTMYIKQANNTKDELEVSINFLAFQKKAGEIKEKVKAKNSFSWNKSNRAG